MSSQEAEHLIGADARTCMITDLGHIEIGLELSRAVVDKA